MQLTTLTLLTALSLTASALPSSKRQANKFEPCTNFGEEWCNDGEILTCKKAPFTDHGWVKSTHKACATKRDVGDWCNKEGVTWCQDYQVLICIDSRITPTGAGCGTKRRSIEINKPNKPEINKPNKPEINKPFKRDVGDWCGKPGVTWCQDYEILTCNKGYKIETTGQVCGTKRTVEVEERGVEINKPNKPEINKPNKPEINKPGPGKRDVGDPCGFRGFVWCQDYQVLTCNDEYRIVETGLKCDT